MNAGCDQPSLLLLADEARRNVLKTSLERAGYDVVDPVVGAGGGIGGDGGNAEPPLESLLAEMAPSKSGPVTATKKPSAEPGTAAGHSLFEWLRFDAVLIQDYWLWREAGAERLIAAGPELARIHHNVLGGFGVKKIILVTDRGYTGLDSDGRPVEVETLMGTFDPKAVFGHLDVSTPQAAAGVGDNVGKQLRPDRGQALERGPTRRTLSDVHSHIVQGRLTHNLIGWLSEQTNLVVIDDEADELRPVAKAWCETELDDETADPGKPLHSLTFTSADRSRDLTASEPTLSSYDTVDSLIGSCETLVSEARGKRRGDGTMPDNDTFFVIDMLFKSLNESGLVLIQKLRDIGTEMQVAVVAYTGLTSPHVAMSAYQNGASLVLGKSPAPARPGHLGADSGPSSLAISLAYLGFCRELLRQYRHRCDRIRSSDLASAGDAEPRLVEQLTAILPEPSVPTRLKAEWRDVVYELTAARLYRDRR